MRMGGVFAAATGQRQRRLCETVINLGSAGVQYVRRRGWGRGRGERGGREREKKATLMQANTGMSGTILALSIVKKALICILAALICIKLPSLKSNKLVGTAVTVASLCKHIVTDRWTKKDTHAAHTHTYTSVQCINTLAVHAHTPNAVSSRSPFGHAGRSLPLRYSILLVIVVDPTRGAGVLHPHTPLLLLLLLCSIYGEKTLQHAEGDS